MKRTCCVLAGIVVLGFVAAAPADVWAGRPDRIPPNPVLNLTATSTEPYAAEVMFTATGDDGSSGQATRYDLRYATVEITESNWDLASRVGSLFLPPPQPAGAAESVRVEGLHPATGYFYGLKVEDDAGNLSALSNVGWAETSAEPPNPWTTEMLTTTGGYAKSLDFHGGPGPFAIGCAKSEGNTVVAVLGGDAGWLAPETVETDIAGGGGIDFAFAPDGTPTVSYGCDRKQMKKGMRFAWRNPDGSWNTGSIDTGTAGGDFTALEYDPRTGEPTVAYTIEGELRFARKVGGLNGAWQVEVVESGSHGYPDMVYDIDGRPVIVYSDDLDGDGLRDALKAATKFDGGWEVVTIHEGVAGYGTYASIAVDELGNMLAADYSSYRLWVFRKPSGGVWDQGEYVAMGSGLRAAFDGAGTPYLSFYMNRQTFVAFDDGDGWQIERVAPVGYARTYIARDPQGGLGVLFDRSEGGLFMSRKPAAP